MDVLIRFKGGCGGETVGRLLSSVLDGTARPVQHDNRNRAFDIDFDVFDGQLLQEFPSVQDIEQFGLHDRSWLQMTDDDLRLYVDGKRQQHSHRRVGLTHYSLPHECDYHRVFGDTVFIDIVPQESSFWLVEALHIYKAACKKIWHLPNWPAHPGYSKMKMHFDQHGWIPSWWTWDNSEPSDFASFILNRGVPNLSIFPTVATSSHLTIDGGRLVIDSDLCCFKDLEKLLSINLDYSACCRWVEGNRQIIENLDMTKYIGSELTLEQQKDILNKTFSLRYDALVHVDHKGIQNPT